MAPHSKTPSKRSSKNENSGEEGAGPTIEDLLHKLPGVDIDHVLDHKKLTETFKKEDRVLHRLADLQRLGVDIDPDIMAYKPNPYNKSILFGNIFDTVLLLNFVILIKKFFT